MTFYVGGDAAGSRAAAEAAKAKYVWLEKRSLEDLLKWCEAGEADGVVGLGGVEDIVRVDAGDAVGQPLLRVRRKEREDADVQGGLRGGRAPRRRLDHVEQAGGEVEGAVVGVAGDDDEERAQRRERGLQPGPQGPLRVRRQGQVGPIAYSLYEFEESARLSFIVRPPEL